MFAANACSSPARSTGKRRSAAGLASVSAAWVVLALLAAPAGAGSTRGIVFEHGNGIYRQTADGGAQALLVTDAHAPNYSADGTKIAFGRSSTKRRGIWIMNADGSHLHRVTRGADNHPAFSPNGRRLAFHREADSSGHAGLRRRAVGNGLYVVDVSGAHLRYVGRRREGEVGYPVFAPNGRRLVYDEVHVNPGIYSVNLRGRAVRRLVSGRNDPESPTFSPDGRTILFTDGVGNVKAIDANGTHSRTILAAPIESGLIYERPVYSPDGQRIAVGTNANEILTMDASGTDLQPAIDDAGAPAWARR